MNATVIRIGIIGTGRIAQKFAAEARTVDELEIAGAYNPHSASAIRFCEEMYLGAAFPSLSSLFESVDAVYIASPHFTHKEYCEQAISAGVHVLCEKPLALCADDIDELFALAYMNEVVLIEGIKTAFYPGFEALERFVQSGRIGEVVAVDASFTKLMSGDVPELASDGGGSMLWLGTYPLYAISRLLGQSSTSLRLYSRFAENGIDLFTRGVVGYAEASASFMVGFGAKTDGALVVTGTEGFVKVPAPWWNTRSFSVGYEDPSITEEHSFELDGYGLRYEIAAFSSMIQESRFVCPQVTKDNCSFIAHAMEQFNQQSSLRGYAE